MVERRASRGVGRRDFLRSAAALGSGFALAPAPASRAARAGDAIHVAFIGTGTQGQNLLSSCLKIPDLRIRAICDIWAYSLQRASLKLKVQGREHRAYTDHRALLEEEKGLDAAIVATPDFLHAEHAIACLEAGLHLYCERPIAHRLEDARRMIRAARETGRLVQVGHQRRSDPRYIHGCERLLGEVRLLGRITALNAQGNRPARSDRGWPRRYPIDEATLARHGYPSMHHFRNWRWYRALGSGPLGEFGSDQIDVFLWALDALPRSVLASGGTDYYDPETHEWPDTAMAIYEFPARKGTARAFYQTISSNGNLGSYEKILGDQGTLLLSEAAGLAKVFREPSAPDWDRWVRLDYLKEPAGKKRARPKGDALLGVRETEEKRAYELPIAFTDPEHKPHLENFFRAIRGEAKLACPPETAYRTLVAVRMADEALRAGRRLAFEAGAFRPE